MSAIKIIKNITLEKPISDLVGDADFMQISDDSHFNITLRYRASASNELFLSGDLDQIKLVLETAQALVEAYKEEREKLNDTN